MTTLVDNGKAHFNYEILEKLEAGIELLGFEVKALKSKSGSLEGSYVIVRGGEAFAMNMFIPPYQEKNTPKDYEPRRNRRLIMTRDDIRKLAGIDSGKWLTIVPISIYNKGPLIKVSIAVVRGKKKFDKRESIKKRETERTIRREFVDR
ncbi:MAG: SsrA-binding protein [Candidatus Taylorbacteria bacterium RIFCSPHIGHO2_02_FULL_45_28]|uniref:SsrA-binding protein n=1 Tax=Candidatus Taylorbacteria bacterium RIFCSPHIGHO2_12_FULL_45_16 TaxID=1802315 RepID=A0A1G2N0V3_9BACT|nr:MAG: SsrA-binding protein [Candidatus Taylorbacteria bacterium RIFCSPHIGHO2_01_FULL_44_110]OHA25010.1 MAG: SsrA-binding protein [Candidatus Taylorbacteria bacterium RIFCSPHIGHO2_02_FULL_45_28]OHA29825.1 MAG: SsrA-binding protein [Candidatus Taylorbacteria bacterium RIFCSPHIGHO2_12_FULL_45_16]OHA32771.1 MAG: SsrA-binding protein [Candidatus Taylorbacteria bacterium RIFCSPLOWO2_01_FULL_45_59]OHA39844.1 MAG: SsrA-binding protein [Candidatus Taylorbacteria bacterium RIFCSPLOWO2_02_FULL_45_10b]